MIYEEYYSKYLDYKKTIKEIHILEDKKVSLMNMVDVKATNPEDDPNTIKIFEDKVANYVAELEITESNLKKKENIKSELKTQLKKKEEELRESNETLDKIYLYKYIERLKYFQICKKINYEKSSLYNFLDIIKKSLKIIRDNKSLEKNGKI